jgi:aldose 1-epimerase
MKFSSTIILTLLLLIGLVLIEKYYCTTPNKTAMRFIVTTKKENNFTSIELIDTELHTSAIIYSVGAIVNAFNIKVWGNTLNVIDGFSSLQDASNNMSVAFKSAKLSPFVCRLNKGTYTFNEQQFKIEKFYLGESAIHGVVFDENFEVLATHADSHQATVGLRYIYNATDKGYPFTYELLINWKLEADNKLSVTTKAIHHNNTPIPFADGWHPYFTLGNSINDCSLQFETDSSIEFNEQLIPTGKILHNNLFQKEQLIANSFLDNLFVLKHPGTSACIFKNKQLQLTIQPDKNYPYLQVYTPPHRKSIAIENLSSVPDAFNNKMGLLLLEPNQQYNFTTTYQLTIL